MKARIFSILAGTVLLAGCAGPVVQDVQAAGDGLPHGAAVMWANAGGEDVPLSPAQVLTREAVGAALVARGYRVVEDAPVTIAAGVSERPADIAVRAGDGATLSPAKARRPLQNCADRMMRLTLHAMEKDSGREVFAGAVQEAHCHAALPDVLPRLSKALAARLPAPDGTTRTLVHARD